MIERDALTALSEESARAVTRPVAPWLPRDEAPELRWKDGSEAPRSIGTYLLVCQSHCGGLDVDPRVPEIARLLDEASLAHWAAVMIERWIDAGADTRHPWCLPLAVMLGGDRAVPVLKDAIAQWHRASRRALATQALQAIALLGSDVAVRALEDVAERHGYDALGAFAMSALQAEADARGISRDELSDAVVPRWGMDARGRATLDYGRRQFYAVLLEDPTTWLNVKLTDEHGDEHPHLPRPGRTDDAALAHEALARSKSLKHDLAGVIEASLRRFERAMTEGRAWELRAWRERVMGNAVLRALARRLVWSVSSPEVSERALVRPVDVGDAGDDFALVDLAGDVIALTDTDTVSLAHPVALDGDTRARWVAAFARAGLARQPLNQLRRRVFRVERDAGDGVAYEGLRGKVLKARSDRHGKAPQPWARAGWEPAPTESGLCHAFLHRFGTTGLEAVLEVEGVALWAEAARSTVVGALRFRAAHAGDDAAWIELARVPPAVVSEAVRGALVMIEGGDRDV